MKLMFFIVLTVALNLQAYEVKTLSKKILPKWKTGKNYVDLKNFISSVPPHGNLYIPAEYAGMEAVLIQPGLFDDESTLYYKKLIKAIYDSGAIPFILINSGTEKNNIIAKILRPNKISTDEVKFLQFGYDSVWARDYGPWDIYLDKERVIIDMKYYSDRTKDDAVPSKLAEKLDEDLYKAPLFTEGGNFMTDGLGSCWVSEGVVEFNETYNDMTEDEIKDVYFDYLGCKTLTVVPPIPQEGTTHVDMFSKVLNQDTILVGYSKSEWGAYPEEIEHLNRVAEIYKNSPKPGGGQWNIIRIPMSFQNYHDSEWGDYRVYYTHTNALLVNNYALIPFYKRGTDMEAYEVYKKALPEYKIVGIDSNAFIPYGGAIHCTTMQIPLKESFKCGNGVIEEGEECEANYLNGNKCEDVSEFSGGKLKCKNCILDYSECELNGNAPLNDKQSGVCKGSKKIYTYENGWVNSYENTVNYEETELTCDGLDNDCDGKVDNISDAPLNINQKGVCKGSRQVCQNGVWTESYANVKDYSVKDDNDDGLDNNCDGQIDESYREGSCSFQAESKNYFFLFFILLLISLQLKYRFKK